MFQIGDKIVYPMHGAGVIEAIEEREILGSKQMYYVMNIRNMHVLFPKEAKVGVRQVVNSDILDDVLKTFKQESNDTQQNPTQRYRSNMQKMKSGDIYEGAQVIRDLVRISTKKALPTGEKVMLDNAKHILTSELMLVKGLDQDQADDLLNQILNINS